MASVARVEIPVSFQTVVAGDLEPVVGATVSVVNRDTGQATTVYSGFTGSGTIGVLLTDSLGNVPGYVVEGSYAIHVGAVSGFGGAVLNWEAARGDGVGNVAPGAIGTAQLQNGSVTYPKLDPLTVQRNLVPVGAVLPYAGPPTTVPGGWLMCDGTSYLRSAFPQLFAAIGTAWNFGVGSLHFRVPDFTDSFPLGVGTYGLGEYGGQLGHTHSMPALLVNLTLPAHHHNINNLFVVGVGDHGHWYGPERQRQAILSQQWRTIQVTQSGSTPCVVPNVGDTPLSDFFTGNAGGHDHGLGGIVGQYGTADGDTDLGGVGFAGTSDDTGPADPPFAPINYIIKADVGL